MGELTSVVQKRFNFPEGTVELYAEKVQTRGLCAIAQAESLRYKLIGGLAVRRACYGVLRFIMESGPKKPLPDNVSIVEPKEETLPPNPFSETKAVKPDQAPGPVVYAASSVMI